MNKKFLEHKDTISLRRKQGKRALAVFETCKIELESELRRLFKVFDGALKQAEEVINLFPPCSRGRGFEASLMQTSFMKSLKKEFEDNAFFGTYKRIILRKKGYIILFKKLNGKGYPMNIKTQNIQSILNQNQMLDLFADTDYNDEPILYFGYQKSRKGEFINPQIVYIDDGEIKFNITREHIAGLNRINNKMEKSMRIKTLPKLKGELKIKKI